MSATKILNIMTVLFASLVFSANVSAQESTSPSNGYNGQNGTMQNTTPVSGTVTHTGTNGTMPVTTPTSVTTPGATTNGTMINGTTTGTTMTTQTSKAFNVPAPAQNAVYDAMVGTWTGESDMMGNKAQDTLNIQWELNHQFLVMNLRAQYVNDPSKVYEGKGIFGLDKSGKPKTWWFDSWGAASAVTGTGTFMNDNKLEIRDSNAMFSEVRTFEIVSANEMRMTAKGKMKINGKEQSFEQTVIYHKS